MSTHNSDKLFDKVTKQIDRAAEAGAKEIAKSFEKVEQAIKDGNAKISQVDGQITITYDVQADENNIKEATAEGERAGKQAIESFKNGYEKAVEQNAGQINSLLEQAMSKHAKKWKNFDLFKDVFKNVDFDVDSLEKKLEKLYNKDNFGTPKTNKQFTSLYAVHQALGGKQIKEYEQELQYLTQGVDIGIPDTAQKNEMEFFQTLFDTVKKLVPLLQTANSEVKEIKQNASVANKPDQSSVLSGKQTEVLSDNLQTKSLEELVQLYHELGTSNGADEELEKVSNAILEIVQAEKQLDAGELQKFVNILRGLTFVEGDSPILKQPYSVDEALGSLSKLSSNQTPLSSENKMVDVAEEAAKEIEVADEKIEVSNEEVEQSEEELEQTTKESRKKASDAAKKESNEIIESNKREIASNEEVAKSRNKKYSVVTIDNIPHVSSASSAPNPLNTETSSIGINNESSSADRVAQSMDKASESKKKFAKANKSVEESAKASEKALKDEADAADEVTDSVNDDKATKQNEKAVKAYDRLVAKGKEYYQLMAKLAANMDFTEKEQRRLEELQQEFYNAANGADKFARAMDELGNHLGSKESNKEYDFAQTRYLQDAGKSYIDSLKESTSDYNKFYNTIAANKRGLKPVVEYQQKIDELKSSIEALETLEKQGINLIDSGELAEAEKLKATIESLKEELRLMKNNKDFQAADQEEAYKQIAKISQILEKNTKMSREMREQFKALQQDYEIVIKTGQSQKRLEELNAEVAKMNANLQASGRTGNSFFNLVGKKINGMAAEFFATYLSLQDLLQLARQGFEIIKEYDNALTEMNKVADESLTTLKEFQEESFALADSIGATASALQNSTAEFLRLGESLEEAKQSAMDATTLFKVSEFDTIDEATEALIALSQAYQGMSKTEINDVLNYVGNEFSISSEGLATALQSSAAALKTAGNDIYEAAALATAGNALIMDPSSAGAGIRTISLRLMGTEEAKDQLAALGEDVDDFVVQTQSKLDEQVRKYTAVASNDFKGVSLLDENGNYRSTYEILQDIADVYEEIVATDKEAGSNRLQALLELIAGKNRSNIAASILQNGTMLREVYEESQLESEGSAAKELAAQLESIESYINQIKNTWDSLWAGEHNREVITTILDIANGFLKIVDNIGLLNTALIGLGAGIGIKSTLSENGRYGKSLSISLSMPLAMSSIMDT